MSSLRVRLRSAEAALAVPETILEVPAKTGRRGLGEVVKHLLHARGFLGGASLTFDFAVRDRLLQTSLAKHALLHGISAEDVVDVDFFVAADEPKSAGATDHDDWVGSVCALAPGRAATGAYNGSVGCVGGSGVPDFNAHEGAVKAMSACTIGGETLLATGGHDALLKCWAVKESGGVELRAVGAGHGNSIGAVAWSSAQHRRVATADWEGMLFLWQADGAASETAPPTKRQKIEAQTLQLVPLETHKAHAQSVSGLAWARGNALYSSSWDHSVKAWDAEKVEVTASANAGVVQTCLAWSPRHDFVASGGHDAAVRLWDGRASGFSSKFAAHDKCVTGVAWRQDADFHLCSVGMDAQILLWDIRGGGRAPLRRLAAPPKLASPLCVAWCDADDKGDSSIFVGGDDAKLHEFSVGPALRT
ncbi:WD40-repeat-containing domain protein [Pelagophyceae sp. CCMP2097]|nr:WD40-repeat-containing domain protein [Pelagophyceae sp. CCMP2097]